MTKEVFGRLLLTTRMVRFAFAALALSLAIGAAQAAPSGQDNSQPNADTHNFTRGGGG